MEPQKCKSCGQESQEWAEFCPNCGEPMEGYAKSLMELGQAQQGNFLAPVGTVVNVLIMIECIVAAFTLRKRALHDMLAESFCVYKES